MAKTHDIKILITGANGFIGRNLSLRLEELGYKNLIRIDRDSTEQDLEQGLQDADFIYHLAGVNRPKTDDEFKSGNS
ncbi:NAD-dependent epimerase/dehydratase family protein, partial [Escherichia coli]|nr:NAD-dependent epimerase/dehydratase family protein [Escherichia coli]EFN8638805.1 NAD-dependent epimerase/dehydratase family protein [Escherichia coli]